MHAIQLPVSIRVEFSFDPQVVSDPEVGILETFNNLSLTVFENGNNRICGLQSGEAEEKRK